MGAVLRFVLIFVCNLISSESFRQFKIISGNYAFLSPLRKEFILKMTANQVLMPALSSTMTEGRIIEWCKKPGDKVEIGDTIMIVESDKADMDFESFQEGYLAHILVPAGESAAVGTPVAIITSTLGEKTENVSPPPTIGDGKSSLQTSTDISNTPAQPILATNVDSTKILMPALSSTMTEGRIISWAKKIGEKVNSGDILLVVESDKADMDVESFEEGYLAAILTPEGESALVGAPVGVLVSNKDDIDRALSQSSITPTVTSTSGDVSSKSAKSSQGDTTPVPLAILQTPGPAPPTPSSYFNTDRVLSSGRARQLAEEYGIDIRTVKPSAADNIVTEKDILAAKGSTQALASSTSPAVHVPGILIHCSNVSFRFRITVLFITNTHCTSRVI